VSLNSRLQSNKEEEGGGLRVVGLGCGVERERGKEREREREREREEERTLAWLAESASR